MRRLLFSVPVNSLVRFTETGYVYRVITSDPNLVELTRIPWNLTADGRLDVSELTTSVGLRVKTDCPCEVVVPVAIAKGVAHTLLS